MSRMREVAFRLEVCTGWDTVAAQKQKERDGASWRNALNQGATCQDWRIRNSWIGGKQGFSDYFGLLRPYKPP